METGNYPFIKEEHQLPARFFHIPSKYKEYIDTLVLSQGLIQNRIRKLAEEICEFYASEKVTLLCVLKGAFRFTKDLTDELDRIGTLNYDLEFVRVKSYQDDCQGQVQMGGTEFLNITNRNVLIVEDLVDTGTSLVKLVEELRPKNPRSIKITVLTYKRNEVNEFITPEFIGFSIPNVWIVGYHCDYNEYFRDLEHLCILNEKGKSAFKVTN